MYHPILPSTQCHLQLMLSPANLSTRRTVSHHGRQSRCHEDVRRDRLARGMSPAIECEGLEMQHPAQSKNLIRNLQDFVFHAYVGSYSGSMFLLIYSIHLL